MDLHLLSGILLGHHVQMDLLDCLVHQDYNLDLTSLPILRVKAQEFLVLQVLRLVLSMMAAVLCSHLVDLPRLVDSTQRLILFCSEQVVHQLSCSPCYTLVLVHSPTLAEQQNPKQSMLLQAQFCSYLLVPQNRNLLVLILEKDRHHLAEIFLRVKLMFMLAKVHSSVLVVLLNLPLLLNQKAQFCSYHQVQHQIPEQDLLLLKAILQFLISRMRHSQDLISEVDRSSLLVVSPNLSA